MEECDARRYGWLTGLEEHKINTAQVIRKALYDIDAVAADETTPLVLTQRELLTWANRGKDLVERAIRANQQDFNLVTRQSDDSTFRWEGYTYAPSSFQLLTTTTTYDLPPDLIELRAIRAVTSGEEWRQFEHKKITHPLFVQEQKAGATSTTGSAIYWDVVGERTLQLARSPDTTLDIEISYVARTRRLRLYTTGTVATTQNSAAVVGTSSQWVIEALYTPAELIVSSDTAAPKIASVISGGVWVDPSAIYSPVSSITSDTAITLHGLWLPASLTGRGYMFATVPELPLEHRDAVAEYVSMCALKKLGRPYADRAESLKMALADAIDSTGERQSADPEFVEDAEAWN